MYRPSTCSARSACRTTRSSQNPSERWWSVAFGDVLVVEFAFGFDSASKVFGSGASTPGHHHPATVARRHGRFVSGRPQGRGGSTQSWEQLRATGFGGVG